MSQRPRLAGDGRVVVPAKVAFDHHGFIRGRFSDRTVDPFDWTEDRLLLAESFARLDLTDRRAVRAWWTTYGAVDLIDFTGGAGELPDEHGDWLANRPPDTFIESRAEVDQEQGNVVWHLATMARLAEHRSTGEWDPSWGYLVIGHPEGGGLIVGGPEGGEELMSRRLIEHMRNSRTADIDRPFVEEQDRLYAAVSGRPVVMVSAFGWFGYWRPLHGDFGHDARAEARTKAGTVGSTWDSAIELERLLLSPYVAQAVERRFTIERVPTEVYGMTRSVLVPREERVWQSVLAPIYLQLFEALRRITEGQPGAAICRECGRPFLVLDARRRFFCNERERYRHAKREQRRRLAEPDLVLADGTQVEIKDGRGRR